MNAKKKGFDSIKNIASDDIMNQFTSKPVQTEKKEVAKKPERASNIADRKASASTESGLSKLTEQRNAFANAENKTARVNLLIYPSLLSELQRRKEATGQSVNEQINSILLDYVQNNPL